MMELLDAASSPALTGLLEQAGVGVALVSAEGKILAVNRMLQEIAAEAAPSLSGDGCGPVAVLDRLVFGLPDSHGVLWCETAEGRKAFSRCMIPLAEGPHAGGHLALLPPTAAPEAPPHSWHAAVLDAGPDALVVVDAENCIVYVNRQAQMLLGYAPGALLGAPLSQIIPQRHQGAHRLHVATYRAQPEPRLMGAHRRLSVLRADGSEAPVEISLSPIEQEGRLYVAAALRDMGERLQMEAALERRGATLEAIAFMAQQFLGSWAIERHLGAACRRLGLAAEAQRVYIVEGGQLASGAPGFFVRAEWAAPGQAKMHPPEGAALTPAEALTPLWQGLLRLGRLVQADRATAAPPERERLDAREATRMLLAPIRCGMAWWGYLGLDLGGSGRAWSEPETDALLTAAAILGAAAENSQSRGRVSRLAAIIESTGDAVIGKNAEGIIVSWNKAAERLYGYRDEEIIGRPAGILLPVEDRPAIANYIEAVASGRLPAREETDHVTRDGRRIHVSLTRSIVRDAGDERIGVSTIVRDVTDRTRTLRQMARLAAVEQRQIGHELHEDLAQRLASAALLTGVLVQKLDRDCPAHAAASRKISEVVANAVSFARELSRRVSPVDIHAEGLMYALRALAEETEETLSVPCFFEAAEPVLVPDRDAALYLYRLTSEFVNAAADRGGVGSISIMLSHRGDDGVLTIEVETAPEAPPPSAEQPPEYQLLRYQAGLIEATTRFEPVDERTRRVEVRFKL